MVYNENARKARQVVDKANRQIEAKTLKDLVPGYTQSMGDTSYIAGVNAQTIASGAAQSTTNKAKSQFAQNIDTLNKTITENPLYQSIKDTSDSVGNFLKQHKKGIAIAGAALGVAAILGLTKKHTSSGRTPEQSPQSNQAPNVDGTYNTEYNKDEGSNQDINPMQKTIRLEENGRGLNVRARGVNRKGIPDDNFNDAISDTMQSTMNAQVNINHSDSRATINRDYVQGLVSNALFAN